MKVSVIVPVYNQENYLRACLDSVLSQTLQDVEVICVNDCSTDHCAQILSEYEKKDQRIHTIQNRKNGGLSYSRNKGLEAASGDYLCFLDSDDMLAKQALESLYQEAEENRTDVIFFNCRMKIESGKLQEEETEFCTKGDYSGIMTGRQFFRKMQAINDVRIPACLQFWNKKRFDELSLGFLNGIVHEDILFTYFGLIQADRVLCVQKPLYIYRRHENSITMQKAGIKYMESLIRIYQEIMFYWFQNRDECIDDITRKYLDSIQWKFNKYLSEMEETVDDLKKIWGADSFYSYWLDVLAIMQKEITDGSYVDTVKLVQMAKAQKMYVYGAGKVAISAILLLHKYGIGIDGIIVSTKEDNPLSYMGISVYGIEEVVEDKKICTVLVGVGKKYREEVLHHLHTMEFENIVEM